MSGSFNWSRNCNYGPIIYTINSFYIAHSNHTSIFNTRFDIGSPNDQNNNINGPYNQLRNFILFKINKTILKMISNICFNSVIAYLRLAHIGPAKLDLRI